MSKFIELDAEHIVDNGIKTKAAFMPVWLFALAQAKYNIQHDTKMDYEVKQNPLFNIYVYQFEHTPNIVVWEKREQHTQEIKSGQMKTETS